MLITAKFDNFCGSLETEKEIFFFFLIPSSGKTGHPLLNAGEMSKCKAQSYRIFPHLKTLGMVLFRPNIQEVSTSKAIDLPKY